VKCFLIYFKLVIMAVSVPWMLLPKPFLLKAAHSRKTALLVDDNHKPLLNIEKQKLMEHVDSGEEVDF
jgi:hypothetical protein